MERLRGERPEVPLHVVAAQARVGHALLRVDEVLKLGRVADEEDRCVVADQVVVALLGVELEGKTARVAVGIGIALLTRHRGEAGKHGRALAHLVEEGSLGPRRNVRGHLEVAEGAAALGVDDALGYALAVERLHLLDYVVILQQDRPVGAHGERVLVACRGNPGIRRRDRQLLCFGVVVLSHLFFSCQAQYPSRPS